VPLSSRLHKTVAPCRENCLFYIPKLQTSPVGSLQASDRRVVIDMTHLAEPVVIKRYANRRLYLPAAGRYVTLDDIAGMVEDEEGFVVRDAQTGEDITPSILKQIIFERATHG
jgi:hypothetical protein